MALETVLLSRSVTYDPSLQGEVSKDIERFTALGFTCYRQVGEIVTIPEVRGAEYLKKKKVTSKRVNEAADAVDAIKAKHGLSDRGIGLLIGCSSVTVMGWRKKSGHGISRESHARLMDLLRQSDSIHAGSSQLRDEVTGAAKATAAMRKGRGRPFSLSDDQKIEAASLRESGKSLKEIAKDFGVSESTVRKACQELA